MKTTLLFLLSVLTACATGPDPADVAAERARWTAVRDHSAGDANRAIAVEAVAQGDKELDEVEKEEMRQLVKEWREDINVQGDLILAWDAKLKADEEAAKTPRDTRTVFLDLLRAYGMATVQLFLEPELKAKAPELYRLVDRDSSGSLSEEEILAIDPTSPAFAVVVTATVVRLVKR